MRFRGKRILVTGSTRGIGRATAKAFAAEGAAREVDPNARLTAMVDYVPLRRMAQPEEIAAGILYLSSAEAAYVTGTSLSIDGGTTAGH